MVLLLYKDGRLSIRAETCSILNKRILFFNKLLLCWTLVLVYRKTQNAVECHTKITDMFMVHLTTLYCLMCIASKGGKTNG